MAVTIRRFLRLMGVRRYDRFQHMKPLGKVGVSLLSLLLFAIPIMACTLQANAMTAAERDCCKRMAQECGKGNMPQSHSCCKTVAMPDHLPAIKASSDLNSAHARSRHWYALPQIPVDVPLVRICLASMGFRYARAARLSSGHHFRPANLIVFLPSI